MAFLGNNGGTSRRKLLDFLKLLFIPVAGVIGLFTLLAFVTPAEAAANHFVTATGAGAKTGADWNNAYAGLPASLTRGDNYYLAVGNYSSHTFNDAESGTSVITISTCTSSTTACTSAAGWSAGFAVDCLSNSSNQAVFTNSLAFSNNYYKLNGACRASDMTGEGIKINNSWPGSNAWPLNLTGRSNITVEYVEVAGAGLDLNYGETATIVSASCTSNVVSLVVNTNGPSWHKPFVGKWVTVSGVTGGSGFNVAGNGVQVSAVTDATHFSYPSTCSGSGTGGNVTGPWSGQEQDVRMINGGSNLYVGYSYIHDSSGDPVEESGTTGLIFEHNWINRCSSNGTLHAEGFASQSNNSNLTIRYNVIQDYEGTAAIDILRGPTTNTTNWYVYGNVFVMTNGNPYNRIAAGDGILFSQQSMSGVYFYNNTIINNLGGTYLWIWQNLGGASCSTINVQNNVIYSSGAASYTADQNSQCTSLTQDHNSFLNTQPPASLGTADVSDQAAPNPFVSWTSGNYALASENADWTSGTTLSAPYNIDPGGVARGSDGTWERGAYEYALGGGTPPPPDTTPPSVPTGLTVDTVTTSSIALSWTASTDNVGVTGYKIYRGGTQIGTSAGTSYTDTGLTASTTYSYTVSAYDAAGNTSAKSASASATTQAAADTTPPTVAISSPAANATLSGTVTISGTAADNVAVATVGISIDGGTYATVSGTTNWTYALNTLSLSNTAHTIIARATDAAGNVGTTSPITVTVNNAGSGVGSSCPTSSVVWQNTTFATQTSAFTVAYDDTPNNANIDGVTGLSLNAATAYTSLAVITRFNASGTIDAINGGAYGAVASVLYTAGSKYHFRVVVDPVAHMYSAYVTPTGGSEIQIANNYAFRTEQATTASLNNWAFYSEVGTHAVCNFVMTAGGTADTTPPTASVTSPASGATLSGTVSVTASASDNVGVTRVELYVDGVLQSSLTSSPYAFSLNTASLTNASHILQVKAYDAAGNVGTSGNVSVTVSNAAQTTTTTATTTTTTSSANTSFQILSATVSSITDTSAQVTITTNQPASVVLNYGPTTNYGQTLAASPYLTTIYENLTGLTQNTVYDFQVIATPQGTNTQVTSQNYVFTTQATPAASGGGGSSGSGTGTGTYVPPATSGGGGGGGGGGGSSAYVPPPSTSGSGSTNTGSTSGGASSGGTNVTNVTPTPTPIPPAFPRNLTLDDTGSDVTLLQAILKSMDYFPTTFAPTTYFGPLTQHALLLFQRDHQLNRSGFLDLQSQTLMNKVAAALGIGGGSTMTMTTSTVTTARTTASTSFTRYLTVGSKGADVTLLQNLLIKDNDYPEALVTGYFGSLTQKAVQRFQAKYGIVSSGTPNTTGYGAVGPRTRFALNGMK